VNGKALIITGAVLAALAAAATPAFATTDRADYAAQVNPICAAGNREQKQLYDSFEATENSLERRARKARGKKRRRLESRSEALFDQLPAQSIAIGEATLVRLRQVPPAPGDESLVSDWLTGRETLFGLIRQSNAIELRIEHLFDNRIFKRARGFRMLDRKERRLRREAVALHQQIEPLVNRDVELGTQLGAAYCETGATGSP
jgi:ribosome-associated translation inhibitor RaiA